MRLTCLLFAAAVCARGDAEFSAFDAFMNGLITHYSVADGALAVAKDGKMIYSRGYGPGIQADSLFRISSVSKPVTAMAILKLVEQGRLKLDARAFDVLTQFHLPAQGDPRIRAITVRELLQHTAGWDASVSFDPMFRTPSASSDAIIRSMLERRLDFDPGSRFAYSNFGYCVLGRVIEKISGTTYEEYVRTAILAPAGIHRMHIGKTRAQPGEVKYFNDAGTPSPYSGFSLDAMDSTGGWIASAPDLVRFASAPILSPASMKEMLAGPADGSRAFYGLGWYVQGSSGVTRWWHAGSLPGTACLLARNSDGYAWAALFNSRPKEDVKFHAELDAGLRRLVALRR
jgi:CubicO group peptidase (beta-lactamase class C family)